MSTPKFTAEQRAAIEARTGSSLLAANAGSGKTAVMVERIAAAIREDGVPVNAILALTFTEKAAGELAERLRRRLTDLGEAEHARAVDRAGVLVLAELGQPPAQALRELAGGLLGEGQGEDRADRDAVDPDRLGDPLDHHRGLARAGVGGQER